MRDIAALKGVAFGDSGWEYPGWTDFEGFDREGVFVAREAEELVGFVVSYVRVSDGEGYISVVATAPSHRRRGIAKSLMRSAIDRFRAMGITDITIDVAADNAAAVRTYQSSGFDTIGEFVADEQCSRPLGQCYDCSRFGPETSSEQCVILQELVALFERFDFRAPVAECARFESRDVA